MRTERRWAGIDIFRGWAILLMVFFHLSYDLEYFNIINFHIQSNSFFIWFRFLIVSMFLLTVGMSLKLAHYHTIHWSKVKKRSYALGLSASLVSVVSFLIFPSSWIYFGILHFVFVISILLLPLLKFPYLSLFISIATFIAFHLDFLNMHWLFNMLVSPLHLPLPFSVDVLRFFPWVSLVLLGMVTISFGWHERIFAYKIWNRKSQINIFFKYIGENALLIYLLHQPILFGFFLLIKEF